MDLDTFLDWYSSYKIDLTKAITGGIRCLGSIFIVGMQIWLPAPNVANLTKACGPLSSVYVYRESGRIPFRSRATVLVGLKGYEHSFWIDGLSPDRAREIFKHFDMQVCTFRQIPYKAALVNGSGEKSYGLIVDGEVIRSPEGAVKFERKLMMVLIPLALVLFYFGISDIRKALKGPAKKYWEVE